jgi:hypothetical protein
LDVADDPRPSGRRRVGAKAGIVEGDLFLRINRRVGSEPASAVELIDVAHALLGANTAILAGAI